MNKRANKILNFLINNGPATIEELAENFSLTTRMIYYNINSIDDYLEEKKLSKVQKKNKKIFIAHEDLEVIKETVNREANLFSEERVLYLIIKLFYKGIIQVKKEAENFDIVRKTLESDLKEVKKIFEKKSIKIISIPGKGITYSGDEIDIRKLFISKLTLGLLQRDTFNFILRNLIDEIHEKYEVSKKMDFIYNISKRIKINSNNFFYFAFISAWVVGNIRNEEGDKFSEDFNSDDVEKKMEKYSFLDSLLEKYNFKLNKLDRYIITEIVYLMDIENTAQNRYYMNALKFMEEFQKQENKPIWNDEVLKMVSVRLSIGLFKSENKFFYEKNFLKETFPERMKPMYMLIKKICDELFGGFLEDDLYILTFIISNELDNYTIKNQAPKKVLIGDFSIGRYAIKTHLKKLLPDLKMHILNIVPYCVLEKYVLEYSGSIDFILVFEDGYKEFVNEIKTPIVKLNLFSPTESFEILKEKGVI